MKLKYLSLIVSVIGVVLLYFLSTLSQPIFVEINEISNYDGKKITTQGFVKEHHKTSYGNQLITIQNNNSSAIAFLEQTISIEVGDLIRVTGEVQKYKEEWEIIVDDIKNVNILKKWKNLSFPIWQLSENPTNYQNLNVNVTGFIDIVYDSYFYLTDLNDKHTLTVFFKKSKNLSLFPGQQVYVNALFYFEPKNLQYCLKLYNENHTICPIVGGI
jgi:RecG-like helicase